LSQTQRRTFAMRIALAQMCSGINPADNARWLGDAVQWARAQGAEILFTPEMSGLLDRDRARAAAHIAAQGDDAVLQAVQAAAREAGIWVALGSLALRAEDGSGKWVNRSLFIAPDGGIRALYDKIHLFDVDLRSGESWRESAAYRAGDSAVLSSGPSGCVIGLSICYDLRFPDLYAQLTHAGAQLLSIPAAFTRPTGEAHWHVLLRARAIEAGVFVVAAAQSGTHADGRTTYGHSLVVDPWGQVLLDMGEDVGVAVCDIDLGDIERVRAQVPAIHNRRQIGQPTAGQI
jgi:predicted amidohydrolase